MKDQKTEEGFSLVETMVAAVIAGIAFVGTMGAVEVASRFITQTRLVDLASVAAQSRLEGKRSVRWKMLLYDDLDHNGVLETVMKDDGQGPDTATGDGIYTAAARMKGATEVWTIQGDRPGPFASVGLVAIRSTVTYSGPNGIREIRAETMRANPAYLGYGQY